MNQKISINKIWKKIFAWGKKTKENCKIKSEKDVLKITND